MATAVRNLLRNFELLPKIEKQQFAWEIIRRSVNFDLPPLSDDERYENPRIPESEFRQ